MFNSFRSIRTRDPVSHLASRITTLEQEMKAMAVLPNTQALINNVQTLIADVQALLAQSAAAAANAQNITDTETAASTASANVIASINAVQALLPAAPAPAHA